MASIIYFDNGQSIRVDNDIEEIASKLIECGWLHIVARNNIFEDKHQMLVNTKAVTRVEVFNNDPA